jgi:DNA-binding response OmpR family regulator
MAVTSVPETAQTRQIGLPFKGGRVGRACLLVVEDNRDLLDLIKIVCEGEGYYVSGAENGEKAISLLEEFRPAAIVTDLMMPEVTGLDLIRHVRSDSKLNETPIIVVSAAVGSLIEEAKGLGATEVIRKPVDLLELVKKIDLYVPQHAPMLQNQAESKLRSQAGHLGRRRNDDY